jgi:hypothetical protein
MLKFLKWLIGFFAVKADPQLPAPAPKPEDPPVRPTLTEKVRTALSITSVFEGDGYGALSGDFDGMGISAGILQWNFGQGSLQERLLKPFISRHGPIDATKLFPPGLSMDLVAHMNASEAVQAARQHMLADGKVKSAWAIGWRKFLKDPRVTALQDEACLGVGLRAEGVCKELGLNPDGKRAFCWAFDLVTQNGSLKGVKLAVPDRKAAEDIISWRGAENAPLWQMMLPKATDEQVSLLITSHKRALESNPRWYADVFARKGTIAMGRGIVHGSNIDLEKVFR